MSMNNSILTNSGAMVALQNLNLINTNLKTTENRVSTGLQVSSAQDNASVFAVAQGLRGNIKSYDAVGTALAGSQGVVSVATAAATSISNTVPKMSVGWIAASPALGVTVVPKRFPEVSMRSPFPAWVEFSAGPTLMSVVRVGISFSPRLKHAGWRRFQYTVTIIHTVAAGLLFDSLDGGSSPGPRKFGGLRRSQYHLPAVPPTRLGILYV